jgi:hypothetical protein
MAKWDVGFDGRWQESFRDLDEAFEWAVFPESERAQREAVWSVSRIPWLGSGAYVGSGGDFGGGGGGGGGGGC